VLDPRHKGLSAIKRFVDASLLTKANAEADAKARAKTAAEQMALAAEKMKSLVVSYDQILLQMLRGARAYLPPTEAGGKVEPDPNNFFAGSTTDTVLLQELAAFRSTPVSITKDLNVYAWWKAHSLSFPHLFICFLAVFSMPGSEIECERLFSICGILTQLRRNRMSDHLF